MTDKTLSSLHCKINVSGVIWQSISKFIQHSNDEVFVFQQTGFSLTKCLYYIVWIIGKLDVELPCLCRRSRSRGSCWRQSDIAKNGRRSDDQRRNLPQRRRQSSGWAEKFDDEHDNNELLNSCSIVCFEWRRSAFSSRTPEQLEKLKLVQEKWDKFERIRRAVGVEWERKIGQSIRNVNLA